MDFPLNGLWFPWDSGGRRTRVLFNGNGSCPLTRLSTTFFCDLLTGAISILISFLGSF